MPTKTPLNQDLKSVYGFKPSTLEDIDYAIYNYLNDEMNIFCESNKGFRKVPIIFANPERAFQVKANPQDRSYGGRTLEYPLISIRRVSLQKNPTNKGKYGVYIPPYYDFYKKGGSIPISRRVVQDKTRERANATALRVFGQNVNTEFGTFPFKNKKIVYETLFVPMPTYVEVSYEIKMISDYQQQMNEIMAPFLSDFSAPAVFKVSHESHSYEAFIEPDFSNDSNTSGLDVEERLFKTTVSMKVLGYLIGADKNQETPFVVSREGAAEITIGRERLVVGDTPEFHADRKDKYRP